MAKREENLKKINDELEKMSDEELDQVAGGNIPGTVEDSKLLYKHGLVDEFHGWMATFFGWEAKSRKIDDGWAKAGITCVTKPFDDNKYFVDGKEISRDKAVKIVEEKFPKIRD